MLLAAKASSNIEHIRSGLGKDSIYGNHTQLPFLKYASSALARELTQYTEVHIQEDSSFPLINDVYVWTQSHNLRRWEKVYDMQYVRLREENTFLWAKQRQYVFTGDSD